MIQTVRCVRFGKILMDENRRPFLLCENCHNDYEDLKDFWAHLHSCHLLERLFQQNTTIRFDSSKLATELLGKSLAGAKQYLIYNFNDAQVIEQPSLEMAYKNDTNENYMDLIKIEEELLDPRWYTSELTTTTTTTTTPVIAHKILEYNELVEAVTPFVQFKENVKTSNDSSIKTKRIHDHVTKTKFVLNANDTKHNGQMAPIQGVKNTIPKSNFKAGNQPIAKRRLSMQKTVSTTVCSKPLITLPVEQSKAKYKRIILNVADKDVPKQCNKPLVTLPVEQSNANLKLLVNVGEKNVLKQKLRSLKPEFAPKPITKRRKTIAVPLENLQLEPEIETDLSWTKKDSALIPAQPKANMKTYQKREKTTSPHTSKNVSFLDAALPLTNTRRTCVAAVVPHAKQSHQQELQPLEKRAQKIVVTKSKPINVIPIQMLPPPPPASEKKQTEQILNKLQTLGLQVKRTNPPPLPVPPPAPPTKADATLELLKKLQSKGMNVKLVNKNTNAKNSLVSKKPKCNLASINAISTNTAKTNFNKGIIIKKVN